MRAKTILKIDVMAFIITKKVSKKEKKSEEYDVQKKWVSLISGLFVLVALRNINTKL